MTTSTTTTTTTTTTATQAGVKLTVGSQSNTVQVGNYVTDVSLQPYIASRIISFYAYNMRPNQLLHVFFDSILVDQYCAPGVRNASNNYVINVTNTSDYTQIQRNGVWGTALYSDSNGFVAGQFNVPAATFKTGDRVLELADVNSLTLGNNSITTLSSAVFTASNLSVTNQGITLTTINPIIGTQQVTNVVNSVAVSSNTTITPPPAPTPRPAPFVIPPAQHGGGCGPGGGAGADPLAQAFSIAIPNGGAGLYATSLEVFFNQTSLTANNGVTVYICDTDNGYPNTGSILPFSTTHLPKSSINVSNNAAVSTKFTFEAPVYLNNNGLYAFVVKPDNNDPDYQVWCANIGNVDVTTNNQVYSQPSVGGTAFYGATQSGWTALQTEYVKFNLNVAQFTQGSGDAYFNNTTDDFLTLSAVSYTNTSAGILAGDVVYSATNSTPNTSNVSVTGVVHYYDASKNVLYVANSSGNFTGNSFVQIHRFANSSLTTPNSTTIVAWANTGSLYNPVVDALVGQFATIAPDGTSLYFEYLGTSNNYSLDTSYHPITLGYETQFTDQERIVASHSQEVAHMSNNKSMTIHAHFNSSSTYLSPVIDMVKDKQLVIQNLISNTGFDYTEYFNNGAEKTKYISEVVTLATGQDSEDIQVILTAYRPTGTDIQVYVKFLNAYDPDPISKKTWTLMNNQSPTLYSSTSNPQDYQEFTFTTPTIQPGLTPVLPVTGSVTASNTSNTITGNGTLFTTDLQVGYYVSMPANSTFGDVPRQVVAITNNTSLQLSAPFYANYTNVPYNLVAPPTCAYISSNSITQVMGYANTSTTNNAITSYSANFVANNTVVNGGTGFITIANANTYLSANQELFYFVPTGNTAVPGLTGNSFYYVAAANSTGITLSNTAGGSVITLTPNASSTETHYLQTTVFTQNFEPGSIISIAGDEQAVVSVANNTYLTVGTPWTVGVQNANIYLQTTNGLTYYNTNYALFNTYIQFQIKVVLQSNSSALVPTLDSLQALALQM